jgi:hypothetical protein
MNSELTHAKLTLGEEQVTQDEEHEGCYDEFERSRSSSPSQL